MNYVKSFIISISLISAHTFSAEGGYSNYIPGFYGDMALAMSPQKGWSIKNDLYYYSAEAKKTVISDQIVADVDIELKYDYASMIYVTETEIFGATYAFMATLPIGGPDIDISLSDSISGQGVKVSDDKLSIGDLTFAPILLYWNDGNFNYSFAEYIVAPTGNYDKDDIANSGLNYWTFETDFSASYTNFETGQDYSVLAGYNYNTKNSDTNYQTGEEFHIDIVINQFISENFAVGIQAFHLQQTTKDKGEGAHLGSFKARATGFGPSFIWIPTVYNNTVSVTAKWLNEIDSKNRLEGDHFFLTVAASF